MSPFSWIRPSDSRAAPDGVSKASNDYPPVLLKVLYVVLSTTLKTHARSSHCPLTSATTAHSIFDLPKHAAGLACVMCCSSLGEDTHQEQRASKFRHARKPRQRHRPLCSGAWTSAVSWKSRSQAQQSKEGSKESQAVMTGALSLLPVGGACKAQRIPRMSVDGCGLINSNCSSLLWSQKLRCDSTLSNLKPASTPQAFARLWPRGSFVAGQAFRVWLQPLSHVSVATHETNFITEEPMQNQAASQRQPKAVGWLPKAERLFGRHLK